MTLFVVKLLIGLALTALLAELLVRIFARISAARGVELRAEDSPGWRTYITFKPLPRFEDTALRPEPPYKSSVMYELAERLRARGARIEQIQEVASAERLVITHDGQRFELTLGLFKRRPEQWLLTVDERHPHGTSAPRDVPASRSMLKMLRELLEGMDISTIRWHSRQHWNQGKIDVWSYKPF